MALLPEYNPSAHYGYFGYTGACCDLAIRSDDIQRVEECVTRGYMDKDTRTLDGLGMVKYAKKYGALRVAAKLVELGWQEEDWPHKPVNQ